MDTKSPAAKRTRSFAPRRLRARWRLLRRGNAVVYLLRPLLALVLLVLLLAFLLAALKNRAASGSSPFESERHRSALSKLLDQ